MCAGWWEEECLYFDQTPAFFSPGGKRGDVKIIDEFTYQYIFEERNGILLEGLARYSGFVRPSHYLSQYHPEKRG